MPYSNLALDADRENGPAARSFAADAYDCIMVRVKRSYRIQVWGLGARLLSGTPLFNWLGGDVRTNANFVRTVSAIDCRF
jgi:hypothetical protein